MTQASAIVLALHSQLRLGRGSWIALALFIGTLYSVWTRAHRQKRLRQLLEWRRRSTTEQVSSPTSDVVTFIRGRIGKMVGVPMDNVRPSDPLREYLGFGDIRQLVAELEEDFQITLPDTRRVLNFTFGELVGLVERQIARRPADDA